MSENGDGEKKKYRPYECKHFKWTSWNHYGVKMPEGACLLRGGDLGSCKCFCDKFEPKEES